MERSKKGSKFGTSSAGLGMNSVKFGVFLMKEEEMRNMIEIIFKIE